MQTGKLWAANLGDSEFEPREIYAFKAAKYTLKAYLFNHIL
ncbi:MAG: hypothetical protein RLZZ507_3350 [Cyanobacteriota bacterium]|jgi:hypothetical protein